MDTVATTETTTGKTTENDIKHDDDDDDDNNDDRNENGTAKDDDDVCGREGIETVIDDYTYATANAPADNAVPTNGDSSSSK